MFSTPVGNPYHVDCSFGYKLVCVDGQFSKPFKSYLGQEAAQNLITNISKESKHCCVMKKHLNKELVMIKEDDENFECTTKYWICDNTSILRCL